MMASKHLINVWLDPDNTIEDAILVLPSVLEAGQPVKVNPGVAIL
jgi:hypothetical protein